MVVSIFLYVQCSTRKFGENDLQTVELLTGCIWSFTRCGFRKTTNKSKLFFFKCRKNKWRKQLKLNKPGAQLNFALGKLSIMTDPLGSRIPGTVFLGWLQYHWFSSAVTIYFVIWWVLKQIVFPVQDSRLNRSKSSIPRNLQQDRSWTDP